MIFNSIKHDLYKIFFFVFIYSSTSIEQHVKIDEFGIAKFVSHFRENILQRNRYKLRIFSEFEILFEKCLFLISCELI